MAIRRPLVIITGELQELPVADSMPSTSDELIREFTATVIAGAPVYVDGPGSVDLARANAGATSDVLGLAFAAVTAAQPGAVVLDGVISLTTGEWDAVAGTTGGLADGQKYYLSQAVAGRIVSTPVTGAGNYVVELGIGLSTTEMNLSIRRRILLAS